MGRLSLEAGLLQVMEGTGLRWDGTVDLSLSAVLLPCNLIIRDRPL